MNRALDSLGARTDAYRVVERASYPETLTHAEFNTPALFAEGDRSSLSAPLVAIVGTRSATTYGKACAYKFAEALASAGVTVVSGGAMGIDSAAHRGAIAAGGRTVAVLGSGIDKPQPSVNFDLFQQIKLKGLLISQFAVGTPVASRTLLARNILIASLSIATIVIEAPSKSGALHTANDATDLGREVFVVPANIDQNSFRGSFALIRDGATLVTHPSDILTHLGLTGNFLPAELPSPDSLAAQILSVMSAQSISAQSIVDRTGLDAPLVLSELTMLELDGVIIRDAGGYALKP